MDSIKFSTVSTIWIVMESEIDSNLILVALSFRHLEGMREIEEQPGLLSQTVEVQ